MSVLGYTTCKRCGVPVLDLIAYKTDGLCPTHHRERVTQALDGFELRGRQMRLPLPAAKPKTPYEHTRTPRRRNAAVATPTADGTNTSGTGPNDAP